ncbi:hypothetical protein TNCV_2203711 [Trichonephila clavipes]|nr:hypothetical protein TNCV_2203711 [Trichonephila clavipes]
MTIYLGARWSFNGHRADHLSGQKGRSNAHNGTFTSGEGRNRGAGITWGHGTTPLSVKWYIEDVSSELDNGGQRLHSLDEISRTLLLSAS